MVMRLRLASLWGSGVIGLKGIALSGMVDWDGSGGLTVWVRRLL
jgi:hypothetical protein